MPVRQHLCRHTFKVAYLHLHVVFYAWRSGPKDHHSVTITPGIFRITNPGLTTKNDKTIVRDMAQEYEESTYYYAHIFTNKYRYCNTGDHESVSKI